MNSREIYKQIILIENELNNLFIEGRLKSNLWKKEKIEDMLKRFRDGKSIKSIAKVYDTSDDTIRRILLDPSGGNMSPEEYKNLAQQHASELRPDLWKKEKIEDMLKRFRDGESLASIANDKVYDTSHITIKKILLDPSGGNMSPEEYKNLVKSRPDLWKKEKIEDMLKRSREGKSLKSIAKHYKTDHKTIKKILLDPSGGNMSPEEYKNLAQQHALESRPDLWEKEKIEDMLKRFRDGKSIKSIAKVYDTSHITIKKILLDPSGGNMSPEEYKNLVKSRPDLWKKEKIEDMLKRLRDGEPLCSIADVYDTSDKTIKRILLDPSGGNMSPEEYKNLAQQHLAQQHALKSRPDLWEKEKIEDMLKRFRDGKSIKSIAKVYDTSHITIRIILLDPSGGNMSPEEYKEIIASRSMGSRIRRNPKASRITPEDLNADPANAYSSRATGNDPALSGPTRDPITEAVDLVVEGIRRKDLHSKKDKIIKFFKSGLSLGKIAKKFKTSHVQIKYLLGIWMSDKEYRNTISIRKNNIRKDLLDKKEEIIDLSKQGLTTRQIAAKFNTGSSQISRLLKKWKEDGSDKNQKEIKKPTAEKPPHKPRKNLTIAQPIDPKQKKQPTPTTDKFKIGDKVYHATFGAGLITNIEGAGSDQRFTIDFETVGQKVLIPTYARLSKNPITEDPIAEAVEEVIKLHFST